MSLRSCGLQGGPRRKTTRFPDPTASRYDVSPAGCGRGGVELMRTCLTIVLAAGEGTRMRASRPKVLHAIGGRPLIAHVLAAAGAAGGTQAVVIGPAQDAVAAAVKAVLPSAEMFVQAERRGTAHAVLAAKAALARGVDDVLVAFADTPLITPATLKALRGALAKGAAVA